MVKDLAVAVFGRDTLATHGLSGRAGNANKDAIAKPALDQDKVVQILDTVQKKFPDVPKKFIRAALREKLNDEHKLRVRKTV
ncbi:BEN domain-containing protein 6-like [Xyrauchen texanus]|nr:BEN domain-containing protein 6-like [Xyrauchen texanus]XP_051980836.1 BEN domain-containing protein 6-like [Xyrauchen texanus]XP_051994335.1 BEN domain-containing protein 6-like [Xyrauchen texanus]XP_052001111.1 BEN domain-containing protein 6-like [Xyrauchen texanus]